MTRGPYRELEERWKMLRRSGARVREVAAVGATRTLLCVELGEHAKPTIALAAGAHGDEPAGVWALLDLVASNALDRRYAYRIWPCMNPSGFEAGTRESADGIDVNRTFGRGGLSPEARAIVTANRDRAFTLSLDLHEDCDAGGFYCFEYGGGEIGRKVAAALDRAGMPIDSLDPAFDLGLPEAGLRRERGRIVADPFEEAALLGHLSYSLLLARHAAAFTLTLETPRSLAWETRLEMHRLAVVTAIAALQAPSQ